MSYKIVDGSNFLAKIEFLDDNDQPLIPKPGYPKIKIFDNEKDVLFKTVANPTMASGEWEANIVIPFLDLNDEIELTLRWFIDCNEGKYRTDEFVSVLPLNQSRDSDIILFSNLRVSFKIPDRIDTNDTDSTINVYQNNNILFYTPIISPLVQLKRHVKSTEVAFNLPTIQPSFYSNLVVASVSGEQYTYRLWVVTPQIIIASKMLEDFLNKARLQNVIPQLDYSTGDLVGYLERGLYYFNMLGIPTSFNGLNMQGTLLEAWVTCSTYYAIAAQLLAEGSLAFNFSGQSISLDIDRTPQLDSALGRVESRIQDTVLPLKKQLAQRGTTTGDGSVGGILTVNKLAIGQLSLSNMPTTRLSGLNFSPLSIFNRR